MRGKISVVSELNKGTVFIIEIPVESEIAISVTGENDLDTHNALNNMDLVISNQDDQSFTPRSQKSS
jgi:hypothetical protein